MRRQRAAGAWAWQALLGRTHSGGDTTRGGGRGGLFWLGASVRTGTGTPRVAEVPVLRELTLRAGWWAGPAGYALTSAGRKMPNFMVQLVTVLSCVNTFCYPPR